LNQPLQYIYYLLDELEEKESDHETIAALRTQCDRMREITNKLNSITMYETKDYVMGSKIIDIDKASGGDE
jgi:hypothetical protein